MLSRRVQVLLEEQEYKELKAKGKKAHLSVGEIFREAVRLYGDRLVKRIDRMKTVEKAQKLHAVVEDWPKMEKAILKARA